MVATESVRRKILNFASWVTVSRLARAARNFTKFNQAAIDFKILSAHRMPMSAWCEQGAEILTPAAANKAVNFGACNVSKTASIPVPASKAV